MAGPLGRGPLIEASRDAVGVDPLRPRRPRAGGVPARPLPGLRVLPTPVHLAVGDAQPVVRAGIVHVLAGRGVDVVGEAGDLATLLDVIASRRPDVVVLDPLTLPEGMEAVRIIREAHPSVAIIVLTTSADRQHLLGAVDAGAGGYLLKDAEPDEIVQGIRAAARGEVPLSPRVAAVLFQKPPVAPHLTFTRREEDVLSLLAEGLANKQIAARLGVSEKTVKAHLSGAFRRIGVSDRTQAALWFARAHDSR
jgi:DNA-binding NarL/FixJ family response regulator